MKHPIHAVFVLVLSSLLATLSIVGVILCERCFAEIPSKADQESKKSGGLPPLVVDTSAPLLLDEGKSLNARSDRNSDKPFADNSACYVCHENYREEELVAWHAEEGTGCVDCHGDSFAHRNDENNITPPDVMFPAKKIDRSCRECHSSHDVSPRDVLARFLERCPEKTNPRNIICTDCHGEHRLKSRTVRWDKGSGELIESD